MRVHSPSVLCMIWERVVGLLAFEKIEVVYITTSSVAVGRFVVVPVAKEPNPADGEIAIATSLGLPPPPFRGSKQIGTLDWWRKYQSVSVQSKNVENQHLQ